MARKKPVAGGGKVDADSRVSVNPVLIEDSRELVTIEPEDSIWRGKREARPGSIAGAIVRLRPPASATDEAVERVRQEYLGKKAERVIVLPRPRPELVPAAAALAARGKAYGAREAVLALVEESSSNDKERLRQLCEIVMGEIGL